MAADGRLTPAAGQPVVAADVIAAGTLYYSPIVGRANPSLRINGTCYPITSGPLDAVGVLSLSLAGLAAATAYDIFAVNGPVAITDLIAVPMPSSAPVTTTAPIPNETELTTGTGATAWINAASAFDGTLVKPVASCAIDSVCNAGMANYLGQDFGIPVTVGRAVVTAPSTVGEWLRGDLATLPVDVDFSDDGATWTTAASTTLTASGAPGQSYPIAFTPSTHRYWRLGLGGNGLNGIKVAQVQFFSVTVIPAAPRGLVLYDGLWVNAAALAGFAPYAATYLGSILTDATGPTVTVHQSYGLDRVYGVFNAYNRVPVRLQMGDNGPPVNGGHHGTPGVTLASIPAGSLYTMAPTNGKITNRLTLISGLADQEIDLRWNQAYYLNSTAGQAAYFGGIGWNSSAVASGTWLQGTIDTTGQCIGFTGQARYLAPPFYGAATAYAIDGRIGNALIFFGEAGSKMTAAWAA